MEFTAVLAVLAVTFAVTAFVVAAVGVLTYWIGRYSAFKQMARLLHPDEEEALHDWIVRQHKAHGELAVRHLRRTAQRYLDNLYKDKDDGTN